MNVLVAGGAGYIGTHTVIELLKNGHRPIVADLFTNSSPEAIRRVEKITGEKIRCIKADLTNENAVNDIFKNEDIDAVMLFSGHKAVGESVEKPLMYYKNNLGVALTVTEIMQKYGVCKLIFSSSCTVYGDPTELPIKESSPIGTGLTNPYGKTKFVIEEILRDIAVSDPSWQIAILRYANPIGAHKSGLIGEDPNGPPQNILPYISQVAVGKRKKLLIFGDDYDTPDGTGVRDYIHVVDLARGHIAALEHLKPGAEAYNLSTGNPVSVFEIMHTFEEASGKKIPYKVIERRPGDIATAYMDPTKANKELEWKAEKTLEDCCADSWRWQSLNPQGFKG